MSAERAPKPDDSYNVVYVLPPWAERKSVRASTRGRIVAALRSDGFKALLNQMQFLALVGAVAVCFYILAPELYRLKSKAGIDLIPGVHAPDVFPFLGR